MSFFSPGQAVTFIIVLGTAFRLVLAGTIGLGVDESYVASVARVLSLSYFDHPPLHFWLIWLTAHLTGSEAPIVLRLPFILLFAGTTWLMFRLGSVLFGAWAGVYAALLLNISPVFGFSTGSWLLPDGPLMFCMLAAALLLARLSFSEERQYAILVWLGVGFWLGLGLLSKYHTIFLVLGYFFFVITSKPHRRMFLQAGPYLALLTAGLFFLPVLFWNYEHGWASFLFQSGRGAASGFYPARLLTNIAGQAVWVLPWIWLPLLFSLLGALAAGPAGSGIEPRQNRRWFLCCLALGPITLFTLATLWGAQGLFHWQAPGYLFVFPLLGETVAQALHRRSRLVKRWLEFSSVAFIAIILLLGSHTATGWMNSAFPGLFSGGDPSLEALDWRDVPPRLTEEGYSPSGATFVITGHWIDAGKLDYALGGRLPVLCLSDAPHHFAFMYHPSVFEGQDALIIGRSHIIGDAAAYRPWFDSVTPLPPLAVTRGGRTEIELVAFYARNFHGNYPLPYGL